MLYAVDPRPTEEIIQENCDRFYMERGACCAGCDHWQSMSSVIGECSISAQVSGEDRMRAMGISYMSVPMAAGHVITRREHACGLFSDTFDWQTLPLKYLRDIGYANRVPVPVEKTKPTQARMVAIQEVIDHLGQALGVDSAPVILLRERYQTAENRTGATEAK